MQFFAVKSRDESSEMIHLFAIAFFSPKINESLAIKHRRLLIDLKFLHTYVAHYINNLQ